jgi:LPXTG-site transpeptidase (sortase) family protein
VALAGLAGLALVAIVGIVLTSGGGGGSDGAPEAVVPTTALGDFDTPTPEHEITPEPGPEPPPGPSHRTSCPEIRGTAYESDDERAWFQQNCSNTGGGSGSVGTGSGSLRASSDRLIMPRLGINAPVNYRTVGTNGQLGDPAGPYDVVWYDFSNFSSFGGYPGDGGNAVLAGHVDYRTVGAAVFYQLRNVSVGDVIQYRRGDGQMITYSVTYVADILPGANWDPIVARGSGDAITLITCNGTFDYTTREYSHRRVVKGVRI